MSDLYIWSVIAFGILIVPYILRFILGPHERDKTAGVVLTLGILGTFTGIFIGLFNFDQNDLTNSLPLLLGGLKLAFLTSIAGLAANVALRVFPFVYGFQRPTPKKADSTGQYLIQAIDRLAVAIQGDEESTLLTQMKLLRTTNTDGFNKMSKSFEAFAEKVVADNTQSLIDALEDVMRDFNAKINEQFGDNFKQLNEAVGNMLIWQKEYKEQVTEAIAVLHSVAGNVGGVDTSLGQIVVSQERINEANDTLRAILSDLGPPIASLAEAGKQASEAYPIIERNMLQLTNASNTFVKGAVETLTTQSNNHKKIVEDIYQRMDADQKSIANKYRTEINKTLEENSQRIQQLDKELGEELSKSLNSLGSRLTALSGKFVEDYTPLTDKLRTLVQSNRNY